jgi:hypothetical protein
MMISQLPTQPRALAPRSLDQSGQQPGEQPPTPPEKPTLVDKIIDRTYLTANLTASTLSGGVASLGAYGRAAAPATLEGTASFYKNLWKAETIGPNLKVIGTVVAAPLALAGAAVGLPISLLNGLYQGGDEVDSSKPRQFTIGAATQEGYTSTKEGWEKLAKSAVESFEEMGNAKLAEGERPIDIPIIQSFKTLAVGATAVAVGGVAGVVSAVVAGLRESGAGIANVWGDESLGLGGKIIGSGSAVIGGAVHAAAYGVGTTLSVAGHGFATTWKKDSLTAGFEDVGRQAWNSVAAAAFPAGTLLRPEKQ